MALLVDLRAELAAGGVTAELVGANTRIEPLIDLYSGHDGPAKPTKRRPQRTLEQIGRATVAVGEEAKGILGFFGGMLVAAVALVRRPSSGHWKKVPHLAERVGATPCPSSCS